MPTVATECSSMHQDRHSPDVSTEPTAYDKMARLLILSFTRQKQHQSCEFKRPFTMSFANVSGA